ncbi:MAG: phage holin family protein [Sphingomicrobium sp.]
MPTAPDADASDRPVGELVHQLVDESKAYARAELALAKTVGLSKAKAAAVPMALLGAAFLVAQAAVVMVAFGIFSMTYWYIGPVFAALLTAVVFAGMAYMLVKAATKRLGNIA